MDLIGLDADQLLAMLARVEISDNLTIHRVVNATYEC